MAKTGDRLTDFPAEHGLSTLWVQASDGTRLRVLDTGNARLPRLLCLHGFPQNAAEWRKVVPLVRDRFRVLCVDLRGFGRSELAASDDYSLLTVVDDIVKVIEATDDGAHRPVHVLSHDWGGPIAWKLVETRPDLVAHHVAVNAPHYASYTREVLANTDQLKRSWYTLMFQIPLIEHLLSANGAVSIVRALKGSSVPGTFTDEDLELYAGPFRDPARMRAGLRYYRAGGKRLAQALLGGKSAAAAEEATPTIATPTIIVWGELDHAISRAVPERMVREACPGAELRYLPDATHWVPDERPDAVARAVIDGMNQVGNRPDLHRFGASG